MSKGGGRDEGRKKLWWRALMSYGKLHTVTSSIHTDCDCKVNWVKDCTHRVAAYIAGMNNRHWACSWAEDIQLLLSFAIENMMIFPDRIYSVLKLGIILNFYVEADKKQARQYLSRPNEGVRDSVPWGTQLKNTSSIPMACMWIVWRGSLQP